MKKYQSKKIGSTIINYYIKNAKAGKKAIKLQVLRSNGRAVQLYMKLGFKTYEVDNIYYKMIYRYKQ